MGLLQTFGSFALVLGILVFVHELGHFLLAKAFGIGVPVFSLGFGPRVLGFRRGGTDYRISAIPLGGYVRLQGDESDEHRTGAPEEFLSRPRWQRFLVFVAGALFNLVLAVLVTWLVFSLYGKDEVKFPERYPVAAKVLSGSPAEKAGVRPGDRVVAVADQDIRNPETWFREVLMSPGKTVILGVERDGQRLDLPMGTGTDPTYHLGDPGVVLIQEGQEPPVIDLVFAGQPAEKAGLTPGDRILEADGRRPVGEFELRALLQASPGREVRLVVERGGREVPVAVVPRDEGGEGKIGVGFRPSGLVHRELSVGESFGEAISENVRNSKVLFLTLWKVIRGDVPVRAFSGPIEIAKFSREAVRGFQSFLGFLAFISLQLGILNLLPIPVLDGGHILILGVEAVMRRDLSERLKERVMQVGFVFLLAFFGFVIYFDVIKTFFS